MGNDLEELVAAINNSDINCFSITDHNIFPAEMFRKISKEINKDKVFFPGIELNLIISDEEKSQHNLTTKADYFHAVVIFNSKENYEEIEKCFAEVLEYENSENYAKDRNWKNISKDFGNKKIDIVKLQLKLAKFDYLFIPHENKEKGLTKYLGNESTQNQEYKKRLFYYNSMGLDGRINKNQEINKHVKHKIYKEIASFTFTDREKFTSKWTWIQFDKTFEGLLIAITDPEYRIFSSTEHLNSPQKNVDEYIAKISFNQKNNENVKERTEIFLHPGYNAIIGTRGSGKTTLAKISAKNDIHDKITDIEYFSDSNIVKIFGESEIAYYRQGEFQTYYEKENRPDTIKFLKNKQDNLYDKLKLNNEELEKKISVISTEISKLCDDFFQINDEDKISVLEENKYIEQEDTLEINNINIDSDKHFQNKERVENVRSTIEIIKESKNKININYSEELSEYKVNNITEELRELDSIISDMDRVINSIYKKVKNIHLKNKEREKYIEFFSQSNRDVSKEINLENQELKEQLSEYKNVTPENQTSTEISETVPATSDNENDQRLMNAVVMTADVYNGSNTQIIGQRAFITIPKEVLKQISEKGYVNFLNAKVKDSGYNWFSIICDDGTGICFAGSFTGLGTYGKINNEGSVTETIGNISVTENG